MVVFKPLLNLDNTSVLELKVLVHPFDRHSDRVLHLYKWPLNQGLHLLEILNFWGFFELFHQRRRIKNNLRLSYFLYLTSIGVISKECDFVVFETRATIWRKRCHHPFITQSHPSFGGHWLGLLFDFIYFFENLVFQVKNIILVLLILLIQLILQVFLKGLCRIFNSFGFSF